MFKVLTGGCEPSKGSKYSAGIDLYSNEDCVICAGETKLIGLGVCIDVQKFTSDITESYKNDGIEVVLDKIENFKLSHYLELHPRSSLRAKGLISNTGIIDLDYKDEIKIIIHNPLKLKWWNEQNENYLFPKVKSDTNFTIKKGDRIAQILLKEHKSYLLGVDTSHERNGGFGSTGN